MEWNRPTSRICLRSKSVCTCTSCLQKSKAQCRLVCHVLSYKQHSMSSMIRLDEIPVCAIQDEKAIKYSLRQLQLQVSVFINCLFLVHSQYIYELTWHEGTSPIAAVVQTWIQKISEKLNIMIRYSERLYGVLVNRANYTRRKVKQCAGSIPKKRFLQLGWEFKLERSEVEVNAISQDIEQFKAQITTLESQKKFLESENQKLQQKTAMLSERIRKITSSTGSHTRSKSLKPLAEYLEIA